MDRRPWGFFATLGFGILVLVVFLISQLAVAALFFALFFSDGTESANEIARSLGTNGDVISVAIVTSTIVCSLMIALLVRLRRGPSLEAYLGLLPVPPPMVFKWLALVGVYSLVYDRLTSYLGRPIVPEFALAAYRSAKAIPLLWVALVLLAPLFEELFFRGFVLEGFREGFRRSRIGDWGAIALTSAVWASIHLQYDLMDMSSIFVLGVIFGFARTSTGSLWPSLAMHAGVNLVATAQAAYYA